MSEIDMLTRYHVVKLVEAENARLREVVGQMAHDHAEQAREIRALKALARDMYACINHVTGTDVPIGRHEGMRFRGAHGITRREGGIMSMLTVQANHLREMAYTVERVKNDAVGKLSLSGSITLAMAAMDMRDAADTIGQLRNTCNDLQSENEKLKQLIRDYNKVPCLCNHNGVRCEYDGGETCELYERAIAHGALRAGVD